MQKMEKRKKQLIELLDDSETLTIAQIVERFNISESTARRLCLTLQQEGLAVRVLNGLKKIHNSNSGEPQKVVCENSEQYEEKLRIAQKAASLVQDRDILYITNGSTTYLTILAIIKRVEQGELNDVVVMTNSLINAQALADKVRVLLTGGELHVESMNLYGYIGEQNIQSAHFNKSFLGVRGVDMNRGVMALDMDTAAMDLLVAKRSERSFILADHTKFNKHSFVVHQAFLPCHSLITDQGISPGNKLQAERLNVDMLVV